MNNVAALNTAQIMILESFASAKTQEEVDELMDLLRNYMLKRWIRSWNAFGMKGY